MTKPERRLTGPQKVPSFRTAPLEMDRSLDYVHLEAEMLELTADEPWVVGYMRWSQPASQCYPSKSTPRFFARLLPTELSLTVP